MYDTRHISWTENPNYHSDMSLQTCHCGWAKMTTYLGLRVHQGKMGCTPKGVRIPKEEQSAWNDCWKPEVDSKTLPVAKKVNMKKEVLEVKTESFISFYFEKYQVEPPN